MIDWRESEQTPMRTRLPWPVCWWRGLFVLPDSKLRTYLRENYLRVPRPQASTSTRIRGHCQFPVAPDGGAVWFTVSKRSPRRVRGMLDGAVPACSSQSDRTRPPAPRAAFPIREGNG